MYPLTRFLPVLIYISCLCFTHTHSIQYVRHLHDRMHVLETRTAPPKEEDTSAADAAAAAMGYGLGMMMGNETLMIANAPAGYGKLPQP